MCVMIRFLMAVDQQQNEQKNDSIHTGEVIDRPAHQATTHSNTSAAALCLVLFLLAAVTATTLVFLLAALRLVAAPTATR